MSFCNITASEDEFRKDKDIMDSLQPNKVMLHSPMQLTPLHCHFGFALFSSLAQLTHKLILPTSPLPASSFQLPMRLKKTKSQTLEKHISKLERCNLKSLFMKEPRICRSCYTTYRLIEDLSEVGRSMIDVLQGDLDQAEDLHVTYSNSNDGEERQWLALMHDK